MKSEEAHYWLGRAVGLLMQLRRDAPLSPEQLREISELVDPVFVLHEASRRAEWEERDAVSDAGPSGE